MDLERSLSCLQEPASGLYPEPDDSNMHIPVISLQNQINTVFSSHLKRARSTGGMIMIQEKRRVPGKKTSPSVPLSTENRKWPVSRSNPSLLGVANSPDQ